ncbi:MAG TPA: hypothetical protein PL105_05560, partial [Caldilineaceae bacterium]|nr:hypothetical protein [Caldilineaceae bacterium]
AVCNRTSSGESAVANRTYSVLIVKKSVAGMIPGIGQTIRGRPKDVVADSRNLVCETPTLFLDAYLVGRPTN